VQVRQGSTILAAIPVEDMIARPDTLVEMQMLESFGPGRYVLQPVTTGQGGGTFQRSFVCSVGPQEDQQPTIGTKRESKEMEELRAKLAAAEKSSGESGMVTALLANVAPIIPQLLGAMKQEGLGMKDLVQFAGVMQQGGGKGMAPEDFANIVRMVKELLPQQQQPDDDGGFGAMAAAALGPILSRLGQGQPEAALAGGQPPGQGDMQTGFADAPAGGDGKALDTGERVWQFVTTTIENAAQSGNPAEVAGATITFLNVADELKLQEHPRVAGFASNPAAAFDELAQEIPSLGGELQANARGILVEQIEMSMAQQTEGAPGE